ncbi:helix-turn-helix transcriptional regulator [Asanoa sp. WMMD1127]|uniref:helix-turn-helix domain-containing protein n=1 Tax=Asanoa sp. WMMD1127 TaxID=3016107 RepID=UPI0024164B12|nr:helix-turn-helix transcriptional regulator [Asanoa sp. WMMD1127]MDG4822270.1 helix-turn-helix transcriptional regulator [Asanoa sp. WMMD1127]
MASSDSPAGARRRVRLAVRRAREAKGITQGDVAEAMEWSLSKVMRIENGEVTISQNDLRPLLSFLGIKDRSQVEALVTSAKLSKQRRQWWEEPAVRDLLTANMVQLVQLEVEATEIRYFYPMVVPGRLQTPAYTQAVLHTFAGELSEDAIEARLRVREMRRQKFLTADRSTAVYVLLDESVLSRQVGGADVLRDQLEHLLNLVGEGRIAVKIIPFVEQATIPMLGTFELISLGNEDDDALLYRESDILDEIVEDKEKIKRHRGIFDRLWSSAHDETTSAGLIKDHATALA